jgi:hypothetical protein
MRFTAAAYCQARARLPIRFFDLLLERFNNAVQRSALHEGRWHSHRTFLVDGSGCSRPESAGPSGRVRPIDGAAARVRLSRRPALGAVSCRHRGAPEAGGRASPHPRSRPGASGPPGLATGRRARRRPGPVFLRPSRPPRAGWRTRRTARVGATDRGVHAGSVLCHAWRTAHTGRQGRATVPLAHLKTTRRMDGLHGKTVPGVLKEWTVCAIVYN